MSVEPRKRSTLTEMLEPQLGIALKNELPRTLPDTRQSLWVNPARWTRGQRTVATTLWENCGVECDPCEAGKCLTVVVRAVTPAT